jgi:hypothetical protein
MRINISDFEKSAQINIVKQRTFLILTKLGLEVNRPTYRIFVNILVNINPTMKNENSFYGAFRAKCLKVPLLIWQWLSLLK